jgi:hypothetical protein
MLLIFITFCVLNSIVNYNQSKRVMKVDGINGSKFWQGRNVDISISSKKIKLCSLGIIRNTMLFRFQIEMFSSSLISRDYISLQALVRFSLIDPPGMDDRFLVPLHLMVRFTLYI